MAIPGPTYLVRLGPGRIVHREDAVKRIWLFGPFIGFSHTSISVTVGFSDGASKYPRVRPSADSAAASIRAFGFTCPLSQRKLQTDIRILYRPGYTTKY